MPDTTANSAVKFVQEELITYINVINRSPTVITYSQRKSSLIEALRLGESIR